MVRYWMTKCRVPHPCSLTAWVGIHASFKPSARKNLSRPKKVETHKPLINT